MKVFKNGQSKICGKQPLKNLKGRGLPTADHTPSKFLKVVFHKFYLVLSWIHYLMFEMELTDMLAERKEGLKNMDSLKGSRSGEKRDGRAVWETLEKSIHILQPPPLVVTFWPTPCSWKNVWACQQVCVRSLKKENRSRTPTAASDRRIVVSLLPECNIFW